MTRSRLWTAGTFVVVLVVFLAGWFLLISPKNSDAADLRDEAEATAAQNVSTQAKIKQLEADQKDLPAQIARIATIKEQIPADPRLPALIRALVDSEESHGTELVGVTPGVVADLTGVDGVKFIPVEIVVEGRFAELTKFLDQLEPRDVDVKDRALLVTGVTVRESEGSSVGGGETATDPDLLSMSVQARVFTSVDVTAVSAPAGGAAGGAGAAGGGPAASSPSTAN